jgi:hypothetical protein
LPSVILPAPEEKHEREERARIAENVPAETLRVAEYMFRLAATAILMACLTRWLAYRRSVAARTEEKAVDTLLVLGRANIFVKLIVLARDSNGATMCDVPG